MREMVLLGDEALAIGAMHAGISAAYGYPGTPSSEIIEFLQRQPGAGRKAGVDTQPGAGRKAGGGEAGAARNVRGGDSAPAFVAAWCANEKTAYEAAVGTSLVG